MQNPIILKENETIIEAGDPYILRFNGKYYLYVSTCDELPGIRVFTSDDLISFKYAGIAAKNEILRHAYAPEVIYKDGKFIMCTSPKGNGHYFLESNSPLGPFEFISSNVANMIDGSFVLDRGNNLHFIRADHNGIAYLDYKNTKLINRKDVVPQIGHAWTEGPSISYIKGRYYLTYCGNDVISSSYRIKIASSEKIDNDYKVQDTPLLISTNPDFEALGHNSIVLAPSLDEFAVVYHNLIRLENRRTTRYLNLNRLYLNHENCACNPSNFEIQDFERPTFETRVNEDHKLEKIDDFLLTPESTNSKFTAELNFFGKTTVILGYKNPNAYMKLTFENNKISLLDSKNNLIKTIKTNFDFKYLHAVRIINSNKCELLIDNVPITKLEKFEAGKIGYLYKENGLKYTAYTNSVDTEILKKYPIILPGKVECNYLKDKTYLSDNNVQYIKLKTNESISFKIIGSENKKYAGFAEIFNKNCILEISTSEQKYIKTIKENESAYAFSLRELGVFDLKKEDSITIKVLKGNLSISYLKFDEILDDVTLNLEEMKDGNHCYLFEKHCRTQLFSFKYPENGKLDVFGLIQNATNYSHYQSNKHMRYMGYFIGFENGLIVIDKCEFDRTRIYDKPYRLEPNKEYTLKVEVIDNIIKVFINDKLEIITEFKYDYGYGYCGLYKSDLSSVIITKYKGGTDQ